MFGKLNRALAIALAALLARLAYTEARGRRAYVEIRKGMGGR